MAISDEFTAYYLGRDKAQINEPYNDQDKIFAAVRLDGKRIKDSDYKHCTFANISFKEVLLQNAHFLNCAFIGCYFRRTEFRNSRFTGCKFIDCNFPHVTLKSCDFKHSSFRGCQIAYSEMSYNLPPEPNLREEITRNLAIESAALGLSSESRKYRMEEIRAREKHLLAAFLGKSQWYKDHYDMLGRIQALIQWILSLLNRWLWGYGERSFVLIRNIFIVSLLIFPVLFYFLRNDLKHSSGHNVGLYDIIYFSVENVIPSGVESGITAVGGFAKILAGIESFFGIVAIALFASYIFRWSLHR